MNTPAGPLPRVARLLDVVAVVGLLLAATVYVTGGFREWIPFGRISITSAARPLFVALVALALRHWLWPRPHLVARSLVAWRRTREAPGVREALSITVATRTAVLVVGFLAVVMFGAPDAASPWRLYQNEFANLPARWDTGWYLGIASSGYDWHAPSAGRQQNIAFFPAYPMLMRYASLLLGRELMWTGVLISIAAFFGALVYLYRFAQERLGDESARGGLVLIASYPFALFFSAAYTEGLFLLTLVGACYHLERGELWRAGGWGLLAGLARPNGCLLSIVLVLIALKPLWPFRGSSIRGLEWSRVADRVAVAAMPGFGMLLYSTYLFFLTGNPLQWVVQNAAWGRVYRGVDTLFLEHAQLLGDEGLYAYTSGRTIDALNLAAVLFVLSTVVPVWRRLGIPYAALLLVNLLPPLMMGGLLSMGRVTSVLFPSFVWLGAALPAAHRPAVVMAFAMLQAFCAALFFTWRPLY